MSMPASDGRFDAVAPNLRPYEEAPACFCTSDIRQRAPPPVLLLLGNKAPGRLRQHAELDGNTVICASPIRGE